MSKNIVLIIIYTLGYWSVAEAQSLSGISVIPTRVVLNGKDRTSSVILRNTSNNEVSYRVDFVEMGFDNDGRFIIVPEDYQPEGFKALSPIVRFSPRQVRLKPGESQVIRILIQRASGLAEGEYRSHLEIRVLPDVSDTEILKEGDPTLLQGGVLTRIGVTLPVVWRSAQLKGKASIESASFVRDSRGELRKIKLKVIRDGLRSVFGDISVTAKFTDGEIRLIAILKNYGIYSPYKSEEVVLNVFGVGESRIGEIESLNFIFENDEKNIGPDLIFFFVLYL